MQPILVVGASGALGQVIARKLIERGFIVRGLSRDPARLAPLVALGLEAVRGDLREPNSLAAACRGVSQLVSTANGFRGTGPTSPTKVDVPGYLSLVAASRAAGVERIVHISAHGVSPTSSVDFFRVKARIDEVIRASGLRYVLLCPSAFIDIWADLVITAAVANRPAPIFGNGDRKANYIAIEDVAEFAARVVARPEIVNESIDLGGPSTLTQVELVERIERALARPIARQRLPRLVLRAGSVLLRPFNEVTARFMALGAWAATVDRPLDHWRDAATRLGIEPMSVEDYLARRPLG